MPETAAILLPQRALAGCVFAAIVRDTRDVTLDEHQRFNHFPASPLVALTFVLQGDARIILDRAGAGRTDKGPWMLPMTVSGPQTQPLTSWNTGAIFAITVGFYPEAWEKLTGMQARSMTNCAVLPLPNAFSARFEPCLAATDAATFWQMFEDRLGPLWQAANNCGDMPVWAGQQRLVDWTKSLIARAAVSGPGRSLRAGERRLRRWTGQTRQSLAFYARIDDLHRLVARQGQMPLAQLADEAGFSDQSHMGRSVRRATGFSPARLNHLIATEESFWCYRLLGERF